MSALQDLQKLRELGAFSDEQENDIKRLEELGALEGNAEEVIGWLLTETPTEKKPAEPQPGLTDKLPEPETPVSKAPSFPQFLQGVGETAASAASSAVAVPVSGFAGLTSVGLDYARGGEDPWGEGAKTVEEAQEMLTFKPKSKGAESVGQTLADISAPVAKAGEMYEEKVVSPLAKMAGEQWGPNAAGFVGAGLTAGPVFAAEKIMPGMATRMKGVKGHAGKKFRTPGEVERANFLESKGLTKDRGAGPTRAQITQSEADIALEEERVKVKGSPVKGQIDKQKEILSDNLRNITRTNSNNFKEGDLPVPSGETPQVVNITEEYVKMGDDLISKAYEAAKRDSKGERIVTTYDFQDILKRERKSDRALEGSISAIRGYAKDLGVYKKVSPKSKAFKPISVDTAEDLVKRINQLQSGTNNRNVKRVLNEIKEAIDNDVAKSGGTEAFKEARAFTRQFYKSLERSTKTRFAGKKNSIMQDILLDRTVGNNMVENVILKKKYQSRDLADFKDFIVAQKGGKQAWQDLRADTVDWILENSLSNKGGVKTLSKDKFATTLKKLGDKNRIRQIFSEAEYKELVDFNRALNLVDRPVTAGKKATKLEAFQRYWDNKSRRLANMAVLRAFSDFVLQPDSRALALPMGYKRTRLAGTLAAEKALEKEQNNE